MLPWKERIDEGGCIERHSCYTRRTGEDPILYITTECLLYYCSPLSLSLSRARAGIFKLRPNGAALESTLDSAYWAYQSAFSSHHLVEHISKRRLAARPNANDSSFTLANSLTAVMCA